MMQKEILQEWHMQTLCLKEIDIEKRYRFRLKLWFKTGHFSMYKNSLYYLVA